MRAFNKAILILGKLLPMRFRIKLYRNLGMKIGSNSIIASEFYCDRLSGVNIGKGCYLNRFVYFHNTDISSISITIGDNVYIGPHVKFLCASHEVGTSEKRAGKTICGSIFVEDGAWIGANSTILPNVRICRGVVIGAGAVVTKSTEMNSLYLGIPAKKVKGL